MDYLGHESRFWPVPLVYSIITNDTGRVAFHVLIGTIAWALVAFVVARMSRYPHFVTAVILLFGLSPQIVRFDLAILSESIGISLMVIFVAASLWALAEKTTKAVSIWLIAVLLFSMTRPSQLIILFMVTAFALLILVRKRQPRQILLCAALLLSSVWGLTQLRNNRSLSELNFYTVLQERVIENDDRFSWFAQEGMPLSSDARRPATYEDPSNLPGELQDFLKLPVGQLAPSLMRIGDLPLAQWVRDDGWTTYARYLITHPNDTLERLADLSSPTLNPRDHDLLPLDSRTVLPRQIFLPWQLWFAAGAIASLIHLRFGRKEFAQLFGATVIIGVVWYSLVVLTSGIEHPRHAVTSAVAFRLVSLLSIIGLLSGKNRFSNRENVPPTNDDSVIR